MSKRNGDKYDEHEQFEGLSREQLEKELVKSRELLKAFGATYYTLLAMKGSNLLPENAFVPVQWLAEAHQLMDGDTLDDSFLGQLQTLDPERSYGGYFEDRDRNVFLYNHVVETGHQIRTNSPQKDKFYPETIFWMQAVLLANDLKGERNKTLLLLQAVSEFLKRQDNSTVYDDEDNLFKFALTHFPLADEILGGMVPTDVKITFQENLDAEAPQPDSSVPPSQDQSGQSGGSPVA